MFQNNYEGEEEEKGVVDTRPTVLIVDPIDTRSMMLRDQIFARDGKNIKVNITGTVKGAKEAMGNGPTYLFGSYLGDPGRVSGSLGELAEWMANRTAENPQKFHLPKWFVNMTHPGGGTTANEEEHLRVMRALLEVEPRMMVIRLPFTTKMWYTLHGETANEVMNEEDASIVDAYTAIRAAGHL